jgi:hypothetical protein
MYLGALRVEDEDGAQPLSLHYYLHDPSVPLTSLQDVRWVAQSSPGRLVESRTEGKPGGRTVLSFLDVSGPDGAAIERVERVLVALRDHVEQRRGEPLSFDGFGAEFYAGRRFPPDRQLGEFEALSRALVAFAREALVAPPPDREFTIYSRHEDNRTVFSWDATSRKTLKDNFPNWEPRTVSIDDDVRAAFEHIHGPFYPHAVETMCPIKEDVLDAYGGVKIVDEAGKTLWFS